MNVENKNGPKYCVVRGSGNISSFGCRLDGCRKDAQYILNNYPGELVYICKVISETRTEVTYKMVDV